MINREELHFRLATANASNSTFAIVRKDLAANCMMAPCIIPWIALSPSSRRVNSGARDRTVHLFSSSLFELLLAR
jgi:hypothetical protein